MTRFQHGQHGRTLRVPQTVSIKMILQLLHTKTVSFSIKQNAKQIFEVCRSALTPLGNLIYGLHFAGGSNINVNDLCSQFKLCFSSVKVFGGSDTSER